jgi:hypothetical protein
MMDNEAALKLAAAHGIEEFVVVFGSFDFVEQEFHG